MRPCKTAWISRRMAALALIAAAGLPALAATEEKVTVDVRVIRATNSNKEVSAELKGLADALKKAFKYTGYKLEATKSKSAAAGGDFALDLISPYKATITVSKKEKDKVTLKVVVKNDKKEVQSTTITIAEGKAQILGGWPLEGGDVVVIAVSAK